MADISHVILFAPPHIPVWLSISHGTPRQHDTSKSRNGCRATTGVVYVGAALLPRDGVWYCKHYYQLVTAYVTIRSLCPSNADENSLPDGIDTAFFHAPSQNSIDCKSI